MLGKNDLAKRPDNWDVVLSGRDFDGAKDTFSLEVGKAGRIVGCTFRDMTGLGLANAYACSFENCKGRVPNANWIEVSTKGSRFEGFFGTNRWTRCRFEKTHFQSIGPNPLFAEGCDFTDTTILGFSNGTIEMSTCAFKGSTVSGSWWERPANLLFRDCTVETREKESFFKTGVYTIGTVVFENCAVSGKRPLVDVHDLRALPHADPVTGPDGQPGTIVFRNFVWANEATSVVIHGTPSKDQPSPKKIVLVADGTVLPEGVSVFADPLPNWDVK